MFTSPRKGGDAYDRTCRAYIEWAGWSFGNAQRALMLAGEYGTEPPRVEQPGEKCKAYGDGSVYTRQGRRDPYMAGITLCPTCHCPHLMFKPAPPIELEEERERELVYAVPEKIHQEEPGDAER